MPARCHNYLPLFAVFLMAIQSTVVHAAPLKIYILAGQSNMQGHAQVRTFEHLGMDPATKGLLSEMQDAGGQPRTIEDVWISSIGHDGGTTERYGKLTADYGAAGRAAKIGPEYTFGIFMQKHVGEPILIIKTAWGGKSLNTDFRPPSAGAYQFNQQQLDNLKKQGKDIAKAQAEREAASGQYYRYMIQHIRTTLENIQHIYPDHDPSAGYTLSGFVWFQGWNDMVDRGVYPQRDQPGGYSDYSTLLAQFIRDVRNDLKTPQLPFVIGVMGAGGPVEDYGPDERRYKNIHQEFRNAMAVPASLPEFQGNVVAVRTELFWDAELSELSKRWGKLNAKSRALRKDASITAEQQKQMLDDYKAELYTERELEILETGKSNAEFHYLGSAKIMARIGKAFADALAKKQ